MSPIRSIRHTTYDIRCPSYSVWCNAVAQEVPAFTKVLYNFLAWLSSAAPRVHDAHTKHAKQAGWARVVGSWRQGCKQVGGVPPLLSVTAVYASWVETKVG
jgi:hypothetical protein